MHFRGLYEMFGNIKYKIELQYQLSHEQIKRCILLNNRAVLQNKKNKNPWISLKSILIFHRLKRAPEVIWKFFSYIFFKFTEKYLSLSLLSINWFFLQHYLFFNQAFYFMIILARAGQKLFKLYFWNVYSKTFKVESF